MKTELLIDNVIEQIEEDLYYNDRSAIVELMSFVPEDNLLGYLGERYTNKPATHKERKTAEFKREIQRIQNSLRDWRDSDPEDNDAHWYAIIDALTDATGVEPQ
jgi:hypothetical protein